MIAPAAPRDARVARSEPGSGRGRHRAAMLLIAGLMLTWAGAFTPEPLVLCTVPGVVGWLLLAERSRSLREAFGWTLLFGAVGIGYGYRWLAPTVQDFGNIPVLVSWLLTGIFGAAGILHGWIFIVMHRAMLSRGRRPHPLVTVLLIVAVEHLPIRLFPWMVGHGAVDVPPLVQAAAWGGVAGVSFVLLCLIVPVHEWLRWAFGRRGPAARPRAALVTFLIGCALYGYGHWAWTSVRAEDEAASRTLRVAIVQANVGRKDKRAAERDRGEALKQSIEAYRKGSQRAVAEKAQLVVWGETAITNSVPFMDPKFDAHVTNGFLAQQGYKFLLEAGEERAFLIGAYERIRGRPRLTGETPDERYNVAALRAPGGRDASWSLYRKVYLIPFGEYLPIGFLDPKEYLPQSFTMRPGTTEGEDARFSSMLEHDGLQIAPFLCYEGILADHVRAVTGERRPDLLASLTNDSWFGDSWEPHQHLNFTRFRAVEHRAPLLRATNTGISAFVNAAGDVEQRLGVYEEGVLVHDVPIVTRERTVFVRYGYAFPWLAGAIALLAFLAALLRPPPIVAG